MTKKKEYEQKKYQLFNPGPVMISEEVRKKLLSPDICHRESEFSELYEKITKKLNNIFKVDDKYQSILLTGSGTLAMESIITSCIKKKALCITNGAFGERWLKILKIYNIENEWLKYKWGEYPNISDIEKKLSEDKEIDSVLMVYSETSTGMINPIEKIGQLTKKYNKKFLVDAVSAIAIDDVDLKRDNIDFCAASSHKGISSIPGISIVCGKKKRFDELDSIKSRNYYCDLKNYYKFFIEKKQTPSTPAIQGFYALDEALNQLINEGIDNKIKKIKNFSQKIRKELINLRFELLLKNHLSNGLTSVNVPKKCTYEKIHNYLKKKGFIIYNGKEHLKNNIFQISLMGCINEKMIDNLLFEIRQMKTDYKL